MFFDNYFLIYTIGNLVSAYVMYKYMRIFYSECKVSPKLEYTAYLTYFFLITAIHLGLKVPLIILLGNIILLFLITFLYEGNFKKSLLSVFIIYFSLMSIEALFVLLTSALQLNVLVPFQHESVFAVVVVRISSLALVFAVQGFKNVKKEYPIPSAYWISLLFIPVGTVTMLFAVFMNTSLSRAVIFICIISALLINIFTFYLYDNISKLLVDQLNKRIAEEQNKYYAHQVELMKTTLDHMRTLRHDLKNKISPLYPLAASGDINALQNRISELANLCQINKEYANSGNTTIDSIINFKFQHAQAQNIKVYVDINLPEEIQISTFDLAVILGNLIDNALEAIENIDDRWIQLYISHDKGRLVIKTSNAYDGYLKEEGSTLLSRKKNTENHGIGIKSIRNIIHKYDGDLHIDYDEQIFNTKVLMYL